MAQNIPIVVQPYFFNLRAGACAAGGNCVGARYLEADYKKQQPLYPGYLVLYSQLQQGVVFQGPYDASRPPEELPTLTYCDGDSFIAQMLLVDPVDRYKVMDGTGNVFSVTSQWTASGIFGFWAFWDVDDATQIYWAADVFDNARFALNVSVITPLMKLGWPSLDIRILPPGSGTSYDPGLHELNLDIDNMRSNAVIHEIGHVAEFAVLAAQGKQIIGSINYGYGGDPNFGHGSLSVEYYNAAYREALANFFMVHTLYAANAEDPIYSLDSGLAQSSLAALRIEIDSSNCLAENMGRRESDVLRALWDVFDSHADGGDVASRGWSGTFEQAIASFPMGFGDHELNEPYAPDGTEDDPDGRALLDHLYHMGFPENEPQDMLVQNCIVERRWYNAPIFPLMFLGSSMWAPGF